MICIILIHWLLKCLDNCFWIGNCAGTSPKRGAWGREGRQGVAWGEPAGGREGEWIAGVDDEMKVKGGVEAGKRKEREGGQMSLKCVFHIFHVSRVFHICRDKELKWAVVICLHCLTRIMAQKIVYCGVWANVVGLKFAQCILVWFIRMWYCHIAKCVHSPQCG